MFICVHVQKCKCKFDSDSLIMYWCVYINIYFVEKQKKNDSFTIQLKKIILMIKLMTQKRSKNNNYWKLVNVIVIFCSAFMCQKLRNLFIKTQWDLSENNKMKNQYFFSLECIL